jgi:Zn-dependent metalloprotease
MAENTFVEKHDSQSAERKTLEDAASQQASRNLYTVADSIRNDTIALVKGHANPMQNVKPDGYSTIPPYLLDEIAKRTGKIAFSQAAKHAEEMQSRGSRFRPRIRINQDDQGSREVYDAQGQNVHPGEKARFEGEAPTGNPDVDKVYDYTGIVRDFYLKEYNRNSIDGDGMKFISTVDFRKDPEKSFNNAFWNGSQMTYGHPDEDSPFKSFVLLDITGHEITHGVTEKEANETYYGQSGALNESISDVFGELIKQYAKHQTADKADWLVGDGIWKEGINGKALRDMLNPGTAYNDPEIGKDPQPADMAHYLKTYKDNGGVHTNSGIPNRAFAIFARAVGGHAWEDPGHIWYAARKAAGSEPSFAQFAYCTIEAAKELGRQEEVAKLQKAWAAVGVTPSATEGDLLTPQKFSLDDYNLNAKKAS